MAGEKVARADAVLRRKFRIFLGAWLVLLVAVVVFGGVSLAKYTQGVEQANSAGVGEFAPVLSLDDKLELEESVSIGVLNEPMQLPFVVSNEEGSTPILVIVELSAEQVLPLEYALRVNGEDIEPDSVQGELCVYTYLVESGEVDFSLSVALTKGEYDERFNGLTNDIRMTVICEQAQIGGAG